MAKKKLNKKVAIIGSVLAGFLAVGVIVVLLMLNKDPQVFLADAKAMQTQHQTLLEGVSDVEEPSEEKVEEVKTAFNEITSNYKRAFRYAKNNEELRIDILFRLAEHHLMDTRFHEADWPKARGAWSQVLNIDPKHIKARTKLLDFYYTACDSMADLGVKGNETLWLEVKSNADELVEIFEEKGQQADPYVLKAQGRAAMQMVNLGLTTELESTAQTAIDALMKVVENNPEDAEAYVMLGRAYVVAGQMRDDRGEMDALTEGREKQKEILTQGVETLPESASIRVALLETKVDRIKEQVQRLDDEAQEQARENLRSLEPEFKELAERFESNPEVYAAMGAYYGSDIKRIGDAVEAMQKAWELDKDNIKNAIRASRFQYYQYNITGDEGAFDQAIDIVNYALNSPKTQDIPGPRQAAARFARLNLYSFLGQCYATRAMNTAEEADNSEWIAKLEEAVGDIRQFFGTEDNPNVQKWQGIIELVNGDDSEAIRLMYSAYTSMQAADNTDAFLCDVLADVFEGRRETGLRQEFISNALSGGAGAYKPELLLDYAEIMTDLGSASQVVSLLEEYEKLHGASPEVEQLRARAYMRAGDMVNAEQAVEKLGDSDEAIMLRLVLTENRIRRLVSDMKLAELSEDGEAEARKEVINEDLNEYRNQRVDLFKKLIGRKAEDVPVPKATCDDLVRIGQKDRAVELMNTYAQAYPESKDAKVYLNILQQPEPLELSGEQKDNIVTGVLGGLDDEFESELNLGMYFQERGETGKALVHFQKAISLDDDSEAAISGAFDAAIAEEDFDTAEELAVKAGDLNLDKCDGSFFEARVAIANEDYEEALNLLDQCLQQRPVFTYAHVLKSKCHMEMGDYEQAVAEARRANQMVLRDGNVAKQLVSVLRARNEALRGNVTTSQQRELESAMQRAVALNPSEWQLQAMYGEYLLDKRPTDAIAILQNLANRMPNSQTLAMLGNSALEVGKRESDPGAKQGLFEIARSAFAKAYVLDPAAQSVQEGYAEYLRVTGQKEKAQEMFGKDAGTMWRFYVRDAQYDKAEEILQKLYAEDSKNIDVLKGLMTVARSTNDAEALKRYSNELLAVDDSVDNRLLQVQLYLELDLIKEANEKLAKFQEENPDEPRAKLLEAWASMSRGELDKALELVNVTIEQDPESAIAYRLRGQIYGLMGRLDEAIDDLQESKSLDPSPTVQMELARIYKRAGRTAEAIGELVGAIDDDRAPMSIRIMLEQMYVESGTKSELESFYRDTIAKYNENAYWHFKYGAHSLRERDYSLAENLFLKSLELSNTDQAKLSALDGYLTALRLGKNYDELYKFAADYTDGQFAPVAYAQIATAKDQQDDRAAAVENFNKALNAAGTNEQYVLKILDNMFKVLGANDVIQWCEGTLAENPDSLTANLTMFKINQATGKFGEGLKYISKCMELASENKNQWLEFAAMKAQLLLMAYMSNPSDDYLQMAIDQHEAILEKQPNNSNVRNNLAYLLAKSGENIDKALEYAKRAHETAPNDHNKMDTYGYVLCKAGEYEKAKETMIMAIQIAEKDGGSVDWGYYEHLGMAQEGLGEDQAAAESYQTAIDLAKEQISDQDKERLQAAVERSSS
ncbi:tetratricopeptide repeat protein [Anaerohalosphaera lusitana]|uniref:Tetratricopeptide repeat protein n=1 Tax=Anaerohalosphaera lusitana TaxID=1936003 RepID=A0A1U9NQ13_9BACT|nr:tetratricopeptide repeat protein [Anaerohalosphaera lusitana]AQT69700.1 tetratricopeptide repeat protein [Anaerohalosphaera lusitana]